MVNPEVSVVIPVYNGGNTIMQALESVGCQDMPLEIVVVDDCSKDHTEQEVVTFKAVCEEKWPQVTVCYHRQDTNQGVAAARMTGVRLSHGTWIAFLDADDCWRKNKLKAQLKALDGTDAVLCCTARQMMSEQGKLTKKIIHVKSEISYKGLLYHNSIVCSSVLVRRDVIEEFPMKYDDSHEDYISWLLILRKYGSAIGIDTPYCCYRLDSHSKSGNKLKSAKMTLNVYKYMGFSKVKACILFISYGIHGVMKHFFIRE